MKKMIINTFIIICVLFLLSCTKKYEGAAVNKLTYITVNYNGGYTNKRVLDFKENKYYSIGYLPVDDKEPDLELKNTFSESEGKDFIQQCYSNGLFDIKAMYSQSGIIDGGVWELIIEFSDGTIKKSKGSNASPQKTFNKCAIAFYNLCGEEVMGTLPKYYVYPPQISYAFHYNENGTSISDNSLTNVVLANYKWNKKEVLEKDLYLINEENKKNNKFIHDIEYKLILYTGNYDYNKKFNRIVLKEYDYNSDLTNEKTVFIGSFFEIKKQIELDIKLNKIYTYELFYKDGNYIQYTFSTFIN